ncbi:hypothetical protein DSO57_1025725 [Entomophthora muscae]|uniref:Uncharacterized protein n=1 Tax=Entomophthora muscae TaxID=34485 RepID=A0ACC2UMV5_9FUNG|nr:hypothetical protein DSO57_1025725 [Entomophthora muscae]
MKFTSFEKQVFNWILVAIGVVAVLSNSLLIHLARRLQHRTAELRLTVLLASVDMAIPFLSIGSSLLNNWYDDKDRLQKFCQFKGPVDFILQYFSFLLVVMIAMKRVSKVREARIPAAVWAGICVYTSAFTSLVLMTAFRSEFFTSPSGVDCSPIAQTSALSSTVVFGLGFSISIALLVTLFCYLNILSHVRETRSKVQLTHKRNPVFARVTGICLVYILFISPCAILIMIESIYKYNTLNQTSIVISIFMNLNSISNACITLFAHSLIFDQLRQYRPFSKLPI